ncbi:MAG: hypothetical protein HOC77_01200 [Chloroflexi bacterium]|jgi:catechol 2,3-dioxygenase-like lactoylglutathione lyase family enzyme|nr:hypothetical protein [Chloroflexota bacterium]MBT4513693.1 hypothetical protein [Chloroflexota bacterium]MBT6682681.1 hypothetical protein [Chloroflexota bacterium]
MHHAINHVHLRSSDAEAAAAWYTEHFGAEVVVVTPGDAGDGHDHDGHG